MEQLNKVLIVDDDMVARFLVQRILVKRNVSKQILTASNGVEALQVINENCSDGTCPELILLDIKMPIMDGFEFLEAFQHSTYKNLPVKIVLLTSSFNPKDVERAKSYPIMAHLIKPLTEANLSTIIA
ncbi:MAG: response regulator [Bacteroidota bacterium]|nr:response regulator [Bacteroidota bacterium]